MAASRSLSAAAAAGDGEFLCDPIKCTGPSKACFYGACINFVPSPPPFLVPSDADGGNVPIAVSNSRRLLSVFLISAASLLAAAFLLLLISYFLLRLRRRRRRLRRQQQQQEAQHPPPVDRDEFFNDDGGGEPHHVWYIRTVGLDDAVIKSIAAFVYKSGDGLVDGGDCSVCLGEFTDGEVVKLLPKCSHAFHLPCIDTWLRSHVNCPLCRAPVVAPAAGVETPAAVDGSVSGRLENTEIEISQPHNQEECAITINLDAGSSSSSTRPLDDENELQPIRRSVSMDSSSLAKLMLRVESEPEVKLGEDKREIEVQGVVISKKKVEGVDCLGKQTEMKRSLSSRSGRIFFPRYGRGRARSSSVLPL